MFTSVGPSLASLWSSLAGLTLPSSQQQKKEEIEGIAKDLKAAERNWKWIEALLADAEKRQIDDECVREWLHDLRDLAYQIEDLRDVYEYEVVAGEVQASKKAPSSSGHASTSTGGKLEVCPSSLSPLLDDSFRKQIAHDLGNIRKEFDAIYRRREALRLKKADDPKYSSNDGISRREDTGRLSEALVCHGRDGDLQQLGDFLTADHGDGSMKLEVIVVIGMGGMGKTTLAQHVLKDPRVKQKFDKIGWVHVSETFDVSLLTKAAIESFSGEECGLSGLSPLQDRMTKLIKDKKVLLVADDVWNTEKIGWESFVTPFRDGAKKGSKILVTTRLLEIVNKTRAAKSIQLKSLSEEHGWSLLKEHAFRYPSDDVDNAEELKKIGKTIVAKCRGLPLSIKLLGSLLRYKNNDGNEWRNVTGSNLLDLREGSEVKKKILGSLYLSYLHLSPKLQSCFKWCSKYPNDGNSSRRLKQSWIAYDLVKDQKEAISCLYELQSRSFLEIKERGYDEEVIMHDHIYDLAQYAQGEEHLNLLYDGKFPEEVGRTQFSGSPHATINFRNIDVNSCCHINTTVANVRILAFSSSANFRIRLSLGKYLRELNIETSSVDFTSCDGCQYQLKCLRLLRLHGKWSSIPLWVFQLYNLRYLSVEAEQLKCLSDSICDLRNLRGLHIQSSEIKCLPEAISRLTNLQELDLWGSSYLRNLPKTISEFVNLQELNLNRCMEIEGLPEGIIDLTNMRILDLDATGISFMPKGIGALSELTYLTYYASDSTNGAGLAELKNMRYLRDIIIHNLCDIANEEDASQAELYKKEHLRRLRLNWGNYRYIPIPNLPKRENKEKNAHDHAEQVLKKLRPHRNLEKLLIQNYRGFKLPSWMGDKSFTKLVRLELLGVNHCATLSPIDLLPSLEALMLKYMDGLKELVPKHSAGHFYSDSMDSATEQRLSFPMLRTLNIWDCKSIELLPLHNLTSLEFVGVFRCENLEHMEPPYHTPCPLRRIYIDGCRKFHFSSNPNFPKPSWELVKVNV